MNDVVDTETRSRMMSGIRGKNTKPEILIRSLLHKEGYRFRLHDKDLPGNPDIVLKRYGAVIFVHGCFWHRHLCHLFKWPRSRPEFWEEKLNGNHKRDQKNTQSLTSLGWRVCVVWECAIKGAGRDIDKVIRRITDWINSDKSMLEISG